MRCPEDHRLAAAAAAAAAAPPVPAAAHHTSALPTSATRVHTSSPCTLTADVLEPYAAFTIFVPLLNNVTGPQAAAFPQLSPNLVLPTVYSSVSYPGGS